MDDETAEIELLEQNLLKTRTLSKRMNTILDSFDTRINKLEKSILPLYTSAQVLNRRNINIDRTLGRIEDVKSSQEDPAVEEGVIMRGPQVVGGGMGGGVGVGYFEAMERLNAYIAFKKGDGDDAGMGEAARLVETGTKKLAQLYTKLAAEASSSPPPSTSTSPSTPPTLPPSFPPHLLRTLTPLATFLRTLPQPSTHPSHPAAGAIYETLKEAQGGYADMRGAWCVKWVEGGGRGVLGRLGANGGAGGVDVGRAFGEWVACIINVAETEHTLLTLLSPLPPLLPSSYSKLLTPLLSLLKSTLASLLALIKKSLSRHAFVALAAYEEVSAMRGEWEEVVVSRRGGEGGGDELKEAVGSLKAVCVRSFPEFLADLKLGAMSRGVDTSVQVVDLVENTISYISQIPLVKQGVTELLVALGDGNWKMGEGMQVGLKAANASSTPNSIVPATSPSFAEGQNAILDHYIYDILTTLLTSISTIARVSRRQGFNAIFLLNNIHRLRGALLSPSSSSSAAIEGLIPPPAKEALNSAYRTAKAGYFDVNFSGLLGSFNEAGAGGGGKKDTSTTKERLTRFYDLLEEVIERHRIARVFGEEGESAGGRESREELAEEVVRLVGPALRKFTQKARDKEFSKNPQKYIKITPDEVEKQLRKMIVG